MPRTERTSRQTLETYIIRRGDDTTAVNPIGWRDAIAALDAIEAEAVAAALARVRERVEGLPLWCPGDWEWVVGRKAVLAIIDEEAGR